MAQTLPGNPEGDLTWEVFSAETPKEISDWFGNARNSNFKIFQNCKANKRKHWVKFEAWIIKMLKCDEEIFTDCWNSVIGEALDSLNPSEQLSKEGKQALAETVAHRLLQVVEPIWAKEGEDWLKSAMSILCPALISRRRNAIRGSRYKENHGTPSKSISSKKASRRRDNIYQILLTIPHSPASPEFSTPDRRAKRRRIRSPSNSPGRLWHTEEKITKAIPRPRAPRLSDAVLVVVREQDLKRTFCVITLAEIIDPTIPDPSNAAFSTRLLSFNTFKKKLQSEGGRFCLGDVAKCQLYYKNGEGREVSIEGEDLFQQAVWELFNTSEDDASGPYLEMKLQDKPEL